MLSKPMVEYQIAEQLCANDVTTFFREVGADGKGFEIVAPYYPCVITAFNEIPKQKKWSCVYSSKIPNTNMSITFLEKLKQLFH